MGQVWPCHSHPSWGVGTHQHLSSRHTGALCGHVHGASAAGLYNFSQKATEGNYDDTQASLETYLGAPNGILATFEETGTADDFPRLMRDLTQRGFDAGGAKKDLTILIETWSDGFCRPLWPTCTFL